MLLKRKYDKKGNVSHVLGLRLPEVGAPQHLTDNLLQQGLAAGWISMGAGKVVFASEPEDVVFAIVAQPGVYCCHCGEMLDGGNEIAQAHVAEAHLNASSPDSENPAGYRQDNFYRCERVS